MARTLRDISGSEADCYHERQRDAYADRLAAHPTSAPARLTATIRQGTYGMWFVRLAGSGYPIEQCLDTPRYAERFLSQLVEDGYAIVDPDGYCDIYDILSESATSSRELDADSAEGPAVAYAGGVRGDSGRGVVVAEREL